MPGGEPEMLNAPGPAGPMGAFRFPGGGTDPLPRRRECQGGGGGQETAAVFGKPAHDARLIAVMHAHGLTVILTFDASGFSRYPGIDVVHPSGLAPS
jgi:hypothetical protein